jgi:hypothetical protein
VLAGIQTNRGNTQLIQLCDKRHNQRYTLHNAADSPALRRTEYLPSADMLNPTPLSIQSALQCNAGAGCFKRATSTQMLTHNVYHVGRDKQHTGAAQGTFSTRNHKHWTLTEYVDHGHVMYTQAPTPHITQAHESCHISAVCTLPEHMQYSAASHQLATNPMKRSSLFVPLRWSAGPMMLMLWLELVDDGQLATRAYPAPTALQSNTVLGHVRKCAHVR